MIVLTGGAGFIGSVILGYLNKQGIENVIVCDRISNAVQMKYLSDKKFYKFVDIDEEITDKIDFIIHFGANSSTLETDWDSVYKSNVLSTRIWNQRALRDQIPMIFASSAAITGNGNGPENLYAFSKLVSEKELTNAAIFRLFNVYGPNEYHKGRMASTIHHWFDQVTAAGKLKIFRNSHEYHRDFIWVEDVAETVFKTLTGFRAGSYDLGTNRSVSFETLADLLLQRVKGEKEYIDMPEDLCLQYQRHTRAKPVKIRRLGVDPDQFKNIEQGLDLYIEYLASKKIY